MRRKPEPRDPALRTRREMRLLHTGCPHRSHQITENGSCRTCTALLMELFEALTSEQRRAAGLLAIHAARETFRKNSDKDGRITEAGFWRGLSAWNVDPTDSWPDRLRDAGFPV